MPSHSTRRSRPISRLRSLANRSPMRSRGLPGWQMKPAAWRTRRQGREPPRKVACRSPLRRRNRSVNRVHPCRDASFHRRSACASRRIHRGHRFVLCLSSGRLSVRRWRRKRRPVRPARRLLARGHRCRRPPRVRCNRSHLDRRRACRCRRVRRWVDHVRSRRRPFAHRRSRDRVSRRRVRRIHRGRLALRAPPGRGRPGAMWIAAISARAWRLVRPLHRRSRGQSRWPKA